VTDPGLSFARHVAHETIDGETIVIHLGNGTYYSFDGPAVEVWALIEARHSREAIIAELTRRYGEGELVGDSVARFIDELVAQELVGQHDGPPVELDAAAVPPAGGIFTPLTLHRFTDMQEFMMVDPVHDVDMQGWPHVKTG
jgi:hypothetical protein